MLNKLIKKFNTPDFTCPEGGNHDPETNWKGERYCRKCGKFMGFGS